MFERLQQLLTEAGARFRVVEHPHEGNSERVAAVRGTEVGQGAKAMLCKLKHADFNVMTIVPGDRRVDFKKVAQHYGHSKASLLSPEEATAQTGCVIGAIPPFSFDPSLRLVVDPELFRRYKEIAFNAGRLDRSIVLNADDYLRIAKPELVEIIVENGT
ncbi:YbaK/prolyl-tRNA synthetase associated domain-containing protein [Undibacterium terreum]|uniref:YbaK/prolyl-tRNA synthetase associated domain-containing protein n=1 Tax=Undibacterium terreum TaxID=1224302 RepID=UPI001664BF38|nr:YbaK/prolyl-tRNA synthetase associated domain-containing protein [Undibacterium terreum]